MTTNGRPASVCPDAETLAAFAEGRLMRNQLAALAGHVENCQDCIATLEAANETIATRKGAPARSRTWWLAVAAAVVAGVVALGVYRVAFRDRSPMTRLIALTPLSARPSEARLSGGFPWREYRGPMRAEDTDADPRRMELIGTAGTIVANADRERSARAQQAAGEALVVIGNPSQAIARLRASVETTPSTASAWSDLAAAQYQTALRSSQPSLLPEALASADRALRIDPRMPEARFNRALILERLGIAQAAREAWRQYLEVDSQSPWAAEARQRLAKLNVSRSEADPQRARTFAEAETLGRWAEAQTLGDGVAARRELDNARAVGKALAGHGESLLSEAVQAIDAAAGNGRATLAEAQFIYRRGRIEYSRGQQDAALADLDHAAALFAGAKSPMALVARYYAASVRFDRNDVTAARSALQGVLADADAHPGYLALGAEVRWQLALTLMVDGDWSGALPLLERSRTAFERLGERNHLGFINSLHADTLLSVGRLDDAWAARIRAFTLLSAEGEGDRLPVSMKAAARMELRSGRMRTARALLDVARNTAADNPIVTVDILIHLAFVDVALGDTDRAEVALRDAAATANRIADPDARLLTRTNLEFAGGALRVTSDPARAREMLTRAVDRYRAAGRLVFLPECYLLRSRTELPPAAAEDLERGIAVLEQSPVRNGAVVGTGVLNAGVALYEDAIRLCAGRGDVEGAFRYAERSRTQPEGVPIATVHELQQRLAASDAAVLQVTELPEELVTICVTERGAAMQRHPLGGAADALSPAELYDTVIRGFAPLLAPCHQLIVVAGGRLRDVPFAALLDSKAHRYLIEQMAVSTAMSASALRPAPHSRASGSLLAVALPSGNTNAGLPESAGEVGAVSALYPGARTIAPDAATFTAFEAAAPSASVIHIAGHTSQESDDAGVALVFAHDRVTWRAIAQRPLTREPVVVLAACNTLRQRFSANVRSQTLGDGFLAAGATDVVGTLTPISDTDASEIFLSIHRHLAAGDMPAEAVRAAQREAIARHSDAWRAVASQTRCITGNEKRS